MQKTATAQAVLSPFIFAELSRFVALQIVAVDGAGHAARAAAAAGKLRGGNGDDIQTVLGQQIIGHIVSVIGDDAAGGNAKRIRAVVPLLSLRRQQIAAAAADQIDRGQLELKSQNILSSSLSAPNFSSPCSSSVIS